MGDNKNFILFAVISLAILIGYNMFYLVPKQQEADRVWEIARQEAIARGELDPALPAPTRTAPQAAPRSDNAAPTSLAFQDAGFVRIETPELSGSISLRGARFDDLVLTNHRVSKDADSDNIQLLKKYGENDAYFASFNWFNRSRAEGMSPTNETAWTADQ
ncbi:MAG: membrane protein insertase YidC, partial [Kordiimonadaceae bacterium]|nr:membrane protein insertase YidC [Kordiimonadaceae bacterium]